MELVLNRITNKKLIMDETKGIMRLYPQLIEDPKIKVKKMSDTIKLKLVIAIGVLIVQMILVFLMPNPVFYALLGGELVAVYNIYTQLDTLNSELELEKKKQNDQLLTVTENKIVLTDNVTNRTYTLEWDKVKQILMTSNCICIMPDYVETKDMNAIILPRDYEIEFLEILQRINKEKLMIFN